MKTLTASLVAGLALTLLAASAAAQGAPWLHVEVRDSGSKAETVNVNVPMSMARIALKAMPDKVSGKLNDKIAQNGKISLTDLRALWQELRDAGDADLVTVDNADQTVRIRREGGHVRIRVEGKGDSADQVRVDLPVSVVDALLSGAGEELNLEAAIAELQQARGDLVNVQDKTSTVRVWIDEKS